MFLDNIRQELEKICPIPNSEWEAFLALFSKKNYEKESFIIKAGDNASKFAFIEKGLVRFFFTTYEGKDFNQTFKAEGDLICSYYTPFAKKESPFSIEALEDSTLYEADYGEFRKFYDRHICWLKIGIQVLEQNFLIKSEREMNLLLHPAPIRYERFCQDYTRLLSRIPRYHQALYLGITPQALSRLTKK